MTNRKFLATESQYYKHLKLLSWFEGQKDIFDPRTGDHWFTKRPLTAKEKLELERRYDNGERKGQILDDMGLLKR